MARSKNSYTLRATGQRTSLPSTWQKISVSQCVASFRTDNNSA